jgi:hypothetical protein
VVAIKTPKKEDPKKEDPKRVRECAQGADLSGGDFQKGSEFVGEGVLALRTFDQQQSSGQKMQINDDRRD